MEKSHICKTARAIDPGWQPAISDTIHWHPEKRVWFASHEEHDKNTVIITHCPFCGLELDTLLSAQQTAQAELVSGANN